MSPASTKPVIFISYAHADEPDRPAEGEIQWLSFVQRYLQPALKEGIFELWVDREMRGGADWDPEIEQKLRACDIFILLVSVNSMASTYIIDKEIAIIRERQKNREEVHFYPLLLTPTPDAGLDKVKDKNLRPRDAKPLSSFSHNGRLQRMTDAANEIGKIAKEIASHKAAATPRAAASIPHTPSKPDGKRSAGHPDVNITGLPETPYERLVGREAQLERLDQAWADPKVNILSLIAEGGAGKSALVNEWLRRLRDDDYRGAEAVLGWSFYSQGSKERATSAEEFLNWALDKLGVASSTTSATAKGEAIAEALAKSRVLLVLDGVEPLQHGLDKQQGELKDQGLRALLRRFASAPPSAAHGLVVITSRLPVKDIARWEGGAAQVENVEELSEEAGTTLLRDNGVWGTDREFAAAASEFGGHALALGLLASFLKETQTGDVRRRDHVRAYLADKENPRHDHASRVMESYEAEWLASQPVAHAIMHMVGLFDRPANADCLAALRAKPAIEGLTNAVVACDEAAWQRTVARLREVRLLAPLDPAAPSALDAHPLVREWFGERLKATNEAAWKAAHGRLYDHLRDTTKEGEMPTLEDLAPLYQAVAHGCRAGRHGEALNEIYTDRICRQSGGNIEFYASKKLGAVGSDLAAISWFFAEPYSAPVATLKPADQSWVLTEAASSLRAQGRLGEALAAERAGLRMDEATEDWRNAATSASNLSRTEFLVGEVATAGATAERAIAQADRSGDKFQMMANRAGHADVLHAAGRREEARREFARVEQRQTERQPEYPLLYSLQGYLYCDLLLTEGDYAVARDRAAKILAWEGEFGSDPLVDRALVRLALGRSHLGLALSAVQRPTAARDDVRAARLRLDEAVDGLRTSGNNDDVPRGLLARADFRRSAGDWDGAARDLDEVEEIAEPGPMRLFLCDMALERARLALARIEAFAPLNGLLDDSPPKPQAPDEAKRKRLRDEAAKQLAIAADYIAKCGYHRRDEELAELQAVLSGARAFAGLPPRV